MTKRDTLILLLGIIEHAQDKAREVKYPGAYDVAVFDTLRLIECALNSQLDITYEGDEE